MKKTIILAMAALMLLTAQCKKKEQKPEEMVMVPITGTVDFGGGSKTDITTWGHITPVDGDKIWIYYEGTCKGYVTCRPTTGQQFNCIGEIDENCLGKECVFMYLGTGSKQADGTTDISGTSSDITFANQSGITVSGDYITGLDEFHVGSCIAAVSAEGTVILPMRTKMAIAYFQLVDENNPSIKIADADVTISGHYNTATINKTDGTLSGNTSGNITVHTDANGCFYLALIPQSDAVDFTFAATGYENAINTFPYGIKANTYYSYQGSSNPIVVELSTHVPANPTAVTTAAGCSSEFIYSMGGSLTLTEAQQVEFGFVCSKTVPNPEVGADNCFKVGNETRNMPVGTTSFIIDITSFEAGQNYYVRAYAIGESGTVVHATGMGSTQTITGGVGPQPLPSEWTNGTNPHPFTVANGVVVNFSQGNLQYIGSASPAYWKFADHQFDYLGSKQNSSTHNDQSKDRDLFGWGTSGWDHGNTWYMPYNTSNDNSSPNTGYGYGPRNGSNYSISLTGDYANADWGVYNTIYAGNTATTGWRLLTQAEIDYLFNTRSNANQLYATGLVGNCTRGFIVLPDDWVLPSGLTFTAGSTNWGNVYDFSQWKRMEEAGAVFLPASGYRGGTEALTFGQGGTYWSSTHNDAGHAFDIWFNDGGVHLSGGNAYIFEGRSVRLVRVVSANSANDFGTGSW